MMRTIEKKVLNKAGKEITHFSWITTEEFFRSHSEDNGGMCVKCGDCEIYGVEPDARAYECEVCGKNGVYGAEELLMAGYVDFSED